jgi:hypothetical protein
MFAIDVFPRSLSIPGRRVRIRFNALCSGDAEISSRVMTLRSRRSVELFEPALAQAERRRIRTGRTNRLARIRTSLAGGGKGREASLRITLHS